MHFKYLKCLGNQQQFNRLQKALLEFRTKKGILVMDLVKMSLFRINKLNITKTEHLLIKIKIITYLLVFNYLC